MTEILEQVSHRIRGDAVERHSALATVGIPISLHTARHEHLSKGALQPDAPHDFVMIMWVISGHAEMGVGNQRVEFGPGSVAIYLPSIPWQFWAVEDVNEVCWFTLDGPLAEKLVLGLDLHAGVYSAGAAPTDQIHALMESLKDPTIQGRRHASLLAIGALYELANRVRTPEVPAVVRQAQQIIEREFGNPELSAEHIADALTYHRGSLSRLFHKHTGVTIIEYLTHVRLQQARSLLQHTDLKIASVARKCGFRETTYFCRWIRKHAGVTARHLRTSP